MPIDFFSKLLPNFLASKSSVGKKIKFNNTTYEVEELTERFFKDHDIDFALFSAGGNISKIFAPIAAKNNCIVIDNSSFFRMNNDVPLVVPEVNPDDIHPDRSDEPS